MNRPLATVPLALLFGVLLMTFSGSPVDGADPTPEGGIVLTDFSADSPDLRWYVQNDNVMGGRSEGGFETVPGELIFAGSTNTNGGGFSSIRTRPFEAVDLSTYDGIELHVKGDGRRYTWQLQTNARARGFNVSYWAEFDTDKLDDESDWQTVRIPFANFYPQIRGFKLDGSELDTSEITELGLYIYDKKDGPFELHLNVVGAYSGK